jgi:thiol-disulfide isomerase/thioredoxin
MRKLDRSEMRKRGARARVAAVTALLAMVAMAPPASHAAAKHASRVSPERLREVLSRHELRTLDGRTQSLASLDGEVVVVNFWASWCKPCRRELPSLDALHAELSKKGGRVVAVSIDEEAANVRRFVRSHGLKLPVYIDGPNGLARALDLDHVPFTVVLDRGGEVAFSTSGSDADGIAEIGAVTRRLVEKRPLLSGSPGGESR